MTAQELKDATVHRCPLDKCQGGFVVDEKTGDSNVHICMLVFRYLRRLQQAEIPIDYWTLSLNSLVVPERYKNHIKEFLKSYRNALDRGAGMLLLGSNGIGKTSLMAEIGKHFVLLDYRVRYFTVQHYMNSKFSDNPIDLDTYDVLLVDELDKAYAKPGSDWVPKTFEELVRQIVSQNRLVVMASNASTAGIKELFGNSVFSAIKRKIQVIPMRGEDYSNKLQDDWDNRLKEKANLFHAHIVGMARFLGSSKRR